MVGFMCLRGEDLSFQMPDQTLPNVLQSQIEGNSAHYLCLRLLVDILGLLALHILRYLFTREIPVIQVAGASAEVRREAQPSQIGDKSIPGHLIHLAPDVRQVTSDACKCNDVDCGLDWTLETEEEGHPD